MTAENIHHGKSIQITITTSIPEFFNIERIRSVIGDSKYIESKSYNKHESERRKIITFDYVYTFREIPGIYDLTTGPNYIQMTLHEPVEESVYMNIIKGIFSGELVFHYEPDEVIDEERTIKSPVEKHYIFIKDISCVGCETFCTRTYDELKTAGIDNLLPELKEYEYSVKHITDGELATAEYKDETELTRCKASFFNMDDALDFRKRITVESKLTDCWLKSLDDIVESVQRTVSYTRNILNNEEEIEIPFSDRD